MDQHERKPQLLEKACKPTNGAEETIEDLLADRKLDEKRFERKR